MSDLVDQLRDYTRHDTDELMDKAADEIDRLRAEKAELVMALEDLLNLKQGCHERADAILDRLSNETEGK